MTQINNLNSISQLYGTDLLPVYSSLSGATSKASLNQILSFFQSNFASPEMFTQFVTPASGASVAVVGSVPSESVWLILSPASTLATLTVVLPLNTECVEGQSVVFSSSQEVTALTVSANGATSVNGAPSEIQPGSPFTLKFNKTSNSWFSV